MWQENSIPCEKKQERPIKFFLTKTLFVFCFPTTNFITFQHSSCCFFFTTKSYVKFWQFLRFINRHFIFCNFSKNSCEICWFLHISQENIITHIHFWSVLNKTHFSTTIFIIARIIKSNLPFLFPLCLLYSPLLPLATLEFPLLLSRAMYQWNHTTGPLLLSLSFSLLLWRCVSTESTPPQTHTFGRNGSSGSNWANNCFARLRWEYNVKGSVLLWEATQWTEGGSWVLFSTLSVYRIILKGHSIPQYTWRNRGVEHLCHETAF